MGYIAARSISKHQCQSIQFVHFTQLDVAAPASGTPPAINLCSNGFQTRCEKLETADSETRQYGIGRQADPAWFHRLEHEEDL